MPVSKKVRFEIFKRDSFKCQYCGRSAPDVILQADHIHPVSKGGCDDLLNLITSCLDCNLGKLDRLLSDDAVIRKRKSQLDELQERREQLEMMIDWQRGLISIEDDALESLAQFWAELVVAFHLQPSGRKDLRSWMGRFSAAELMEAMHTATANYLEFEGGQPTHESVERAWHYIPGICVTNQRAKDEPHLKALYYARSVLRNHLPYVNERQVMPLMTAAIAAGVEASLIKHAARQARTWTGFRNRVHELMEEV
jgi:hypothetical protein